MTYYAQYGIDKVIEDNYLEDFYPLGYMMECGAGNGESDSVCLHFEQDYDFKVINVEAHPALIKQLIKNRPNSLIVPGALSSFSGELSFLCANHQIEIPGGSISYKKNYDKYLSSLGYKLIPVPVPCFSYDNLILDFKVSLMNLLVLDVEGHELDVLKGMNTCLPRVICAEYPFCGLDELKRDLGNKGYRFDFVSYNNALFSRDIPEKDWVGKTDLWQS